jgi:phospholipid/cholesterol/gamma-HCH transport system substrate-binding protein
VLRSLSRWQAVVLALVVVLGVGLGGIGLWSIGSRGWFGGNALTVAVGFPEIRGVEVGTRVRIQGIDAGEVVALVPPSEPGGAVLLRLRLRGEYRHLVRTRSRVQIVSEGLIGGKVLEIQPGKGGSPNEPDEPVAEGALLASAPTTELKDVLGEVGQTLEALHNGKGSIPKLINEPDAANALVSALNQIKETSKSIQDVSEGMSRLPLVGGYVENPVAVLERPNSQRDRRFFAEADLFEPGQAILTARGRSRLDDVAPWLEGMKHKGSEVVVVAYADPSQNSNVQTARVVTRQQSEAVCNYLKSKHSIQKMGWFSSRKVIPLGQGLNAPPSPERDALPPARIEVLVFIPANNS